MGACNRSGGSRGSTWPGLANLHVTIEVKERTLVLFIACHIDFASTSQVRARAVQSVRAEVCTPVPGKAVRTFKFASSPLFRLLFQGTYSNATSSSLQHVATCSQIHRSSDMTLCLSYMNTARGLVLAYTRTLSTNLRLATL